MTIVDYTQKAKKTKIEGHSEYIGLEQDVIEYDSRLEARCAQCLLRERIKFQPHKKYEVIDRNGEPFNYEIDFDLKRPTKFSGIDRLVDSLEVKGVLKPHDFKRKDAFEYSANRDMWICTEALVRYWYEHGMNPRIYKTP